jgi:hypothetical protein
VTPKRESAETKDEQMIPEFCPKKKPLLCAGKLEAVDPAHVEHSPKIIFFRGKRKFGATE